MRGGSFWWLWVHVNEMLQAFQDILKQSKGVQSQTEEALAGVVGKIERAKLHVQILPR